MTGSGCLSALGRANSCSELIMACASAQRRTHSAASLIKQAQLVEIGGCVCPSNQGLLTPEIDTAYSTKAILRVTANVSVGRVSR